MKKIIFTLFYLFNFLCSFAQNERVLFVEDFIEKVKAHHPLVKVASLQIDIAKANLMLAKGGFDPALQIDISSKMFDNKNYYNYNQAELKIPMPIGDLKTGIENNSGKFLSSEVSSGRSSYFGFEVPLAKGLLIDKRRAFLQQAKIALQQNNAQNKVLVNELLLDAYISYYQWAGATKLYNVFANYVQISINRLKLVKTAVENGDRPAMDSTEAITQLQNFELLKADANSKLISASLDVNNFVWDGKGIPQNISNNVIPDTSFFNNNMVQKIEIVLQNNGLQNPLLMQYKFKIDGLIVDKRLKYQNLLPIINLKANFLNDNYNVTKNLGSSLLENFNRWGLDIKIPIRFREGRGQYNLAKFKIEESTLELKLKTQEIDNKIKDYTNQFFFLQKQIQIASDALRNYSSLLKNELLRFNNGESSLFFVNTRENKVIEMQQKIIELQVKLLKAKYTFDWVAGLIN